MSYLLVQILLCLLIAGIIGAIIGWLLRGDCDTKIQECEKKWQRKMDELEANWSGKYQEADNERKDLRRSLMATKMDSDVKTNLKSLESDSNLNNNCHDIEEIEGIGPAYGKRLRTIGISTTCDLIKRCLGNDNEIEEVARTIKVKKEAVADWTGMADLMRLKGVDGQFAELIQTVGTTSVELLAKADAKKLYEQMKTFNEKTSIVPELPSFDALVNWIEIAKKTDKLV